MLGICPVIKGAVIESRVIKNVIMLLLALLLGANSQILAECKIVTTTAMITDIVRIVAGERCSVTGLMGAGVDPHLYKPTRSDIALLSSADIVFYNGLMLEGKMTDALVRVATSGKKVYAVTELLDQEYLLEPAEFQGHYDPHVWMDPNAWREAVREVAAKLSGNLPEFEAEFESRAKQYIAQLEQLDQYASKVLGAVPEPSRVLITAHDAFNYFGKRYKFEVRGIQGISTESEAGVRDIENLVNLLVDKQIKAVFAESTVSERNVQALIEGAKARGHSVRVGGKLFSDAMGRDKSYEGTYLGMIDHNVTTIARALGADISPRGWLGKLEVE